jgi:hypothetical protein
MVRVRWSRDGGQVRQICSGNGPGEFTEDVDTDRFRESLEEFEEASETTIVSAVMDSYEGRFQGQDYHVVTDTYAETDDEVTTIAFVELSDAEARLKSLTCNCGFSPSKVGDVAIETRTEDGWTYDDVYCPDCGEIIHIELVNMPESETIPSGRVVGQFDTSDSD